MTVTDRRLQVAVSMTGESFDEIDSAAIRRRRPQTQSPATKTLNNREPRLRTRLLCGCFVTRETWFATRSAPVSRTRRQPTWTVNVLSFCVARQIHRATLGQAATVRVVGETFMEQRQGARELDVFASTRVHCSAAVVASENNSRGPFQQHC